MPTDYFLKPAKKAKKAVPGSIIMNSLKLAHLYLDALNGKNNKNKNYL